MQWEQPDLYVRQGAQMGAGMYYQRRGAKQQKRLHRIQYDKNPFHNRNSKTPYRQYHNAGNSMGRQFQFYIILLVITVIIAGVTLNRIELNIVAEQVKAAGIDYDSFREMLLPVKTIKDIKNKIIAEEKGKEEVKGSSRQVYGEADYITLSMLLNGYDLNKSKSIGKRNMNYLIDKLSYNKSFLELKKYYNAILEDIKCFPVGPKSDGKLNITFIDTWNSYRSYGGNRRHEGTDLMSGENIRGEYPVISMTDGTVEKMGWLEQGGYRIGIRGICGAYYYYAHLYSYAPDLQIGDTVKAGDFLGYMGDSGYGTEGTIGKFDVHLHVGIYVETDFGELSVNPYWILRYLDSIR